MIHTVDVHKETKIIAAYLSPGCLIVIFIHIHIYIIFYLQHTLITMNVNVPGVRQLAIFQL